MGAWETLSGQLFAATDKEFERKARPLLKLFQPDIIQAPSRRGFDRAGIDFLVPSDDHHFPWVVQCKGFYEREDLGPSQVAQILESIASFKASPFSCRRYLLIHNRTAENRAAAETIESKLAQLRREEKAETTSLWDRQTFIRECKAQLRSILVDRLHANAKDILNEQKELFRFGAVYLSDVPVVEKTLRIRPSEPMGIDGENITRRRVAELVVTPKKSRWTLLIGEFGTGKTTTALHASIYTGHNVIYVPAAYMIDTEWSLGTNAALHRIIEATRMFDDLDDETRALVDSVAGRTLASILTGHDAPFALVIDGLDENRVYSRADGIRRLTSELSELKCPIVLTTRKAHFDSMFSSFGQSFENVSRKGGARRDAKLFDLQLWTNTEVCELIRGAMEIASETEVKPLKWLLDAVETGEAKQLYGDLPRHPLFLQMILDDAASGRIAKRNRGELVRDWVELKIKRDLKVSRATPTEVIDVETFVETMMVLQERVARHMTVFEDNTWRLLEQIQSDKVEAEAREVFRELSVDISTVLACSVLSAVTPRSRGQMPIKFLLRVCQEFFLAAQLRRAGEAPDGMPEDVVAFWEELG